MADVTDTQGTRLRRNGTVIPAVFEIGPIGVGRTLRDVTALSDSIHKHKMNIPDHVEIACKLWYDPQEALHRVIISDHASAALSAWQIDLEQGNSPEENITWATAYVSDAQLESMSVDGDMVLSFNLKPQALPVGLFDQ